MAVIIPAILARTEEEVAQLLLHAKEFATEVQVDIVDGVFAKPASWPYAEGALVEGRSLSPLPHLESLRVELDLMVNDPEETLATWMNTGATRILFHQESTLHMRELLQRMRTEYGYDREFLSGALSVGIAIGEQTRLELLEPYVPEINYVQFMGIKRIGSQGQPFSSDVFAHIRRFRAMYPAIPVQVDGGITLAVAKQLLELGVSRLVVGSSLWNAEDPKKRYQEFCELTEHYGIYE